MDKNEAIKILRETEDGYDRIADKFSETRKHFWRDMEFIKEYAARGDKILDYGCGNGRLLELFSEKNIDYTGLDISGKMVNFAKERYNDPLVKFRKITSFDSLAFPGNFFNAAYSVSVFHHLPSRELRVKVAKELFRVVRPGGTIIVSVWNLWQKRYFKRIFVNWANKTLGRSRLDWNDCWVDFKDNKRNIFNRYHHAYTKGELRKIFREAGFLEDKCETINGKNIVFIGRKRPA